MKLSYFISIVLLIIMSIFQTTTFYNNIPDTLRPDVVGIIVIITGILFGSRTGGITGIFGGLMMGLPLLHFWGYRAFMYCLIGLLAGLFKKRLYTDNPITLFIMGTAGVIILNFLPPLFSYISGEADALKFNITDLVSSIGISIIIFISIYYFLSMIIEKTENEMIIKRS